MRRFLTQRGNADIVREVLQRLAYTYPSGPFKGCIIAREYDPERDPASRFLQRIAVRVPNRICRAVYKKYVYLAPSVPQSHFATGATYH